MLAVGLGGSSEGWLDDTGGFHLVEPPSQHMLPWLTVQVGQGLTVKPRNDTHHCHSQPAAQN